MKSYSELIQLKTFDERFKYLQVYDKTPGNKNRKLLNDFYKSNAWLYTKEKVMKRDLGCDLGVSFLEIDGTILVHHINPITEEDVINGSSLLLDLENLISVSIDTHNKIHYKKEVEPDYVERKPGDTKLW